MGWGDKSEEKSSTFVWGKKMEKEGLKNLTRKEQEQLNRRKKNENIEELEKLKKRRLEREAQRAERKFDRISLNGKLKSFFSLPPPGEDEACQQQRAKEAAQFDEWQKQEETFHLEQARLRSKIRINDGNYFFRVVIQKMQLSHYRKSKANRPSRSIHKRPKLGRVDRVANA